MYSSVYTFCYFTDIRFPTFASYLNILRRTAWTHWGFTEFSERTTSAGLIGLKSRDHMNHTRAHVVGCICKATNYKPKPVLFHHKLNRTCEPPNQMLGDLAPSRSSETMKDEPLRLTFALIPLFGEMLNYQGSNFYIQKHKLICLKPKMHISCPVLFFFIDVRFLMSTCYLHKKWVMSWHVLQLGLNYNQYSATDLKLLH